MSLEYERYQSFNKFLEDNGDWCFMPAIGFNTIYPVCFINKTEDFIVRVEAFSLSNLNSILCINDRNSLLMFTDTEGWSSKSVILVGKDLNRGTDDVCSMFEDWKTPTQEEKDYFKMIYGMTIPWNIFVCN
jgi:hypothetical protein